jgi:hypothetical protein
LLGLADRTFECFSDLPAAACLSLIKFKIFYTFFLETALKRLEAEVCATVNHKSGSWGHAEEWGLRELLLSLGLIPCLAFVCGFSCFALPDLAKPC